MANKYWVGGTGTWSQTAHWSLSSGGAGGAAVPAGDDVAIFDSGSGGPGTVCTMDQDFNVAGAQGNITLNSANVELIQGPYNIIVSAYGTNPLNILAGIFTGGSGSITTGTADLIVNAGAIFTAPSGIMTIRLFVLDSGCTFNHNNGTVNVYGYGACSTGDKHFYNFNITASVNNSLTITGTLYIEKDFFSNRNGGASYVLGNIELTGANAQNLSGNGLLTSGCNTLRINKSAGTVTMINNFHCTNLTIEAGNTLDCSASNYTLSVGSYYNYGTFVPRSGLLYLPYASVMTPGNITYYDVTFSYTSNSPNTINGVLKVSHNLTSLHLNANYVQGEIRLVGSDNQVVAADGINNASGVNWLTIQKTGGTVTFSTAFSVNQRLLFLDTSTTYFAAGKTYTIFRVDATGLTAGITTIRSTIPGTPYIFNVSSVAGTMNYVDVQDANSAGGVTVYYGIGCVNSGNNTNWKLRGYNRAIRVRAKAIRAITVRAATTLRGA